MGEITPDSRGLRRGRAGETPVWEAVWVMADKVMCRSSLRPVATETLASDGQVLLRIVDFFYAFTQL